tara:strand:- start:132 stop:551 length:420 start_codon:yes stop_codon:yes gene_type:complete
MLIINKDIVIGTKELITKAVKSSGPGGQNINKNSTAIILHFDIANSKFLSKKTKNTLLGKSSKYLTKSGKIIIKVNKHKSQKRNKSEAVIRLIDYFNKSIETPKKRYKTKPKLSSIKKRLTDKRRNSIKKNLRKKPKLE